MPGQVHQARPGQLDLQARADPLDHLQLYPDQAAHKVRKDRRDRKAQLRLYPGLPALPGRKGQRR